MDEILFFSDSVLDSLNDVAEFLDSKCDDSIEMLDVAMSVFYSFKMDLFYFEYF